jgi:hypothetical protein
MPKTVTAASTCGAPLRAINLFVLNKLHLLDDSPSQTIVEIAERLVGLHAKRPQSPYLSLYARSSEFSLSKLDAALYEDRALLRAHCMRGTVHMLPLSQYETVLSATAGQLDGMYRRAFDGISNKEAKEKAALELIRKKGPLSHAEIEAGLKIEVGERDLYMILNELCTRRILVKATVNGSWRSSVYNYELLDRWQPEIPSGETDTLKSRSKLVEWYLAAYGPATLADVSWWAGVSQAQARKAIAGVNRPLSYVRFDALGTEAFIFDDDLEALRTWRPPGRPQIKLLPGFDPYVMAYVERGRYISGDHYSKVFKKVSGIIEPVVIVDGWIVGAWKYSLERGKLVSEIFERIDNPQTKTAIDHAIAKMAEFLARADDESGRDDFEHVEE